MGYIPSDVAIADIEEVKDYITQYQGNQYIMQLLYSFAEKYPGKVVYKKTQKKKSATNCCRLKSDPIGIRTQIVRTGI